MQTLPGRRDNKRTFTVSGSRSSAGTLFHWWKLVASLIKMDTRRSSHCPCQLGLHRTEDPVPRLSGRHWDATATETLRSQGCAHAIAILVAPALVDPHVPSVVPPPYHREQHAAWLLFVPPCEPSPAQERHGDSNLFEQLTSEFRASPTPAVHEGTHPTVPTSPSEGGGRSSSSPMPIM